MSFWTTELQHYLDKIINEQFATNKTISQAYQNAMKSITSSNEVQEALQKSYENVFAANDVLIQSLRDVVAPLTKSITASNELKEAILKSQFKGFDAINAVSGSLSRALEINDSFSNSISSLIDTPPEDYVTIDETVLNEIDIPDKLVFSIGKHRIKISTSLFVNILGMVISIFLTIAMAAGNNNQATSVDMQDQNQILIEQNQLLVEQNQVIFDLLNSVDASQSSQANLINSWKESFLNEDE